MLYRNKDATQTFVIQVMLLSYTTISRTICLSFRCSNFKVTAHHWVRVLTADMTINCDGHRYNSMFVLSQK